MATTREGTAVDFVRGRAEAAHILGISVRTLTRMEAAGKAPPRVKITDRIVGYRDSDIKKFLDARTAA
jgi:predicted DNA-binding transcriptional regulator AlpA